MEVEDSDLMEVEDSEAAADYEKRRKAAEKRREQRSRYRHYVVLFAVHLQSGAYTSCYCCTPAEFATFRKADALADNPKAAREARAAHATSERGRRQR
jgi:hypothetical protein